MKDKEGNVIVVDEENAADVARKEMELEKEGKDPESEVVEDLKLQPEKEEEEKPVKDGKKETKTGKAKGKTGHKARKKAKIKVVAEKPLNEKIKKIMVAKAVKAAEKDDIPPENGAVLVEKEAGIKEVGIKEKDALLKGESLPEGVAIEELPKRTFCKA